MMTVLLIAVAGLGALLVVLAGSPVVARLVKPYSEQIDVNAGLESGGQAIGYAERLLIYVFVLADAPTAIGFLVTAKSIFRFGDVTGKDKRKLAEYIIIGTLTSFAYAVTASYGIRLLLRLIG
ncbi:MAG: hypothetical protein GVY12_06400 [Bacteroidetes bacterium]|jgi:predicted permease|nr:hypothetical protein [Bacteroidota bacterium]